MVLEATQSNTTSRRSIFRCSYHYWVQGMVNFGHSLCRSSLETIRWQTVLSILIWVTDFVPNKAQKWLQLIRLGICLRIPLIRYLSSISCGEVFKYFFSPNMWHPRYYTTPSNICFVDRINGHQNSHYQLSIPILISKCAQTSTN